jgi:hypothetical protein
MDAVKSILFMIIPPDFFPSSRACFELPLRPPLPGDHGFHYRIATIREPAELAYDSGHAL